MKVSYVTTLIALLFIAQNSHANDCSKLVEKLLSCTKFSCIRTDSDDSKHHTRYHVIGLSKQNKNVCLVTETMENNRTFKCSYDKETLNAAARMLTKDLKNITTIDKHDQALMLEAWNQGDCTIQKQG